MPALVVDHVSKHYPTPTEPLVVLEGVSLSLDPGESLAIVGPSGAGKSTLLSILGALEPPTSGKVLVNGQNPYELSEKQLPTFRGQHIGFVFQEHFLLPQCTVLENTLAPLLADGSAGKAEQHQAQELLERVGLSNRLTHLPAELSGGERQRVAIARALVRKPQLVLADEPTGNLDQATAQNVTQLLQQLVLESNLMLICVTHSQNLAQAMQQRLRLDSGALVRD